MPQCRQCGMKGLFLKIEEATDVCCSCNEDCAQEGKIRTERPRISWYMRVPIFCP